MRSASAPGATIPSAGFLAVGRGHGAKAGARNHGVARREAQADVVTAGPGLALHFRELRVVSLEKVANLALNQLILRRSG